MSLRTTVASLAATALMLSACGGESSDPDKSPSSASSALSTETAAGAAEFASADLTRTASELGVDKLEPDIVGEAGADESCTFMSPGVEVVISADYLSAETDVAHEVDNEIGGREVSSSEPEFGGQPGHLIVNADEQAQMLLVTTFVELADGRVLRVRGQNSAGPAGDATAKLEAAITNLTADLAGAG